MPRVRQLLRPLRHYQWRLFLPGAVDTIEAYLSKTCSPSIICVIVCSAAGAGACASFVTNPLDLVKLRLQVRVRRIYKLCCIVTESAQ